jgi:hypothetical protein
MVDGDGFQPGPAEDGRKVKVSLEVSPAQKRRAADRLDRRCQNVCDGQNGSANGAEEDPMPSLERQKSHGQMRLFSVVS